jgi:branched-chain amino acid transport system permease protein
VTAPFFSRLPAGLGRWLRPAVVVLGVVVLLRVLDGPGESFWTQVVTRAIILVVFAVSADLVWGYTGVFTLGHAIPFGVGGYAAGLLADRFGWSEMIPLVIAAAAAAAAVGAITGLLLFLGRQPLTAIAVSLATLALSFVAERVAFGWSFLGAANGLPGLPIPTLFGWRVEPGVPFFVAALITLLAVYVASTRLVESRLGLVMRAVRDDEVRAAYLGYAVGHVRFAVFVVSNGLAGLAGALFALHEGFVGPTQIGVVLSTQVLLWLVLGGRGVLLGAVVGVGIVEVAGRGIADEYPRQWPVILGVVLLVFVTALPGGIVDGWRRLRRRAGTAGPPTNGVVAAAPEPTGSGTS